MSPNKLQQHIEKYGENANPFIKRISPLDRQRILDAGERMGKKSGAPRRWVATGLYPYELIYAIEHLTNGAITAPMMRPEMFYNVPSHAELGKTIVKMFMVGDDDTIDEAMAESLLNTLLKINPHEYFISLKFIGSFTMRGSLFVERLLANVDLEA